jgi:hypothetical protein
MCGRSGETGEAQYSRNHADNQYPGCHELTCFPSPVKASETTRYLLVPVPQDGLSCPDF